MERGDLILIIFVLLVWLFGVKMVTPPRYSTWRSKGELEAGYFQASPQDRAIAGPPILILFGGGLVRT